jgi:hypothetical protein
MSDELKVTKTAVTEVVEAYWGLLNSIKKVEMDIDIDDDGDVKAMYEIYHDEIDGIPNPLRFSMKGGAFGKGGRVTVKNTSMKK